MVSVGSVMNSLKGSLLAMLVLGFLAGCSTQPVMPERMITNVSLPMHSVDYFNRFALEHPLFDQLITVEFAAAPMTDLTWVISKQAGISVHAIDRAGGKQITIDAPERPLRSILRELAESYGFLYEVELSSSGDVTSLIIHNVDPIVRGRRTGPFPF